MCRLRQSSFGLDNNYLEKSVYEDLFALKYFGGWSFIEAYNLPIGLRKWFVQRLARQIKEENEAAGGGGKKPT
jgi:hypothetical protein